MVHDEATLQERAMQLGKLLESRGACMAVAESCTGGLLSKVLTDIPGASSWFERGLIVYSNAAKQQLLGVPEELLEDYGAVSQPVAEALAAGLLERAPVDYTVAITGVAGPSGGTMGKPVGTVWVARASAAGVMAQRLQMNGDRQAIRLGSAAAAIGALLGA
ncbi:CinA family protein [Halorhodospira halochloris]|uniref:CinA family protein n=1 Tax=Halorhodospira halochloris TaxID=1052 RepID=UPI001EE79AD7|nr:CinA family protein [Halorhodospira halochloris]MCG5530431.1 CinA family protein [Halorhodospira halochloris]